MQLRTKWHTGKPIREVRLGPQLVDLGLHATLTKKRKIYDIRASIGCANCSYTPYTFRVMLIGKEEGRRKKKKKEERNRNFRVRFSRLSEEVMVLWRYILHKNS